MMASMQSFMDAFKGKKITLLGLGLLGRGVGDAIFLAECGAHVTVTDKKTSEQLAESVAKLQNLDNITLHLGGHVESDFTSADLVIKAAGVRLDSPEVAAAHASGIPVAMSTALFAKYASEAGAIIVGVTGTRGKSTVTHMIHHALLQAGRRSHVGGNIRGVSTLAQLPSVEKGDIAVLELDSWQLQGFGDLQLSPHIAIFSNLMPDHQNYYRDMDEYFNDKANIFRYQKPGDTLIIGPAIAKRVRDAGAPIDPIIPTTIPADWLLRIPGEHNRQNAALAAAALLALGVSSEVIQSGLESFEGVEGRLQLVGQVSGAMVYNDNNATTPEATVAALRALDTGKKDIVLIVGGSDKELDLAELADAVQQTCKSVVLLAGTGTDRLKSMVGGDATYSSLDDAVAAAFDVAGPGDIVLFSPAFASFGMFKNEYERNDEFVRLITERKER